MAILKRVTTIFQAKANKMLDKMEDPRETLDLSYQKQLEMLQQVKRSLADVATARRRLEMQASQLQQNAQKLQDQAKQAVSQNRDDLAKEALTRRAAIAQQLSDLEIQHQQLVAQEDKLTQVSQTLQQRIEAFRAKSESLKASYTAAQAQTKVGEMVSGISEEMGDVGLAMQRAQDKIGDMQARAGAIDDLLSSGALSDVTGSSDPLQSQLDQISASSQVDAELAQLKASVGKSDSPGLGSGATGDPNQGQSESGGGK